MLGVTIRFDTYHEAEENLCHILEVETNSPADLAGLLPMSDYLLGTAEKVSFILSYYQENHKIKTSQHCFICEIHLYL